MKSAMTAEEKELFRAVLAETGSVQLAGQAVFRARETKDGWAEADHAEALESIRVVESVAPAAPNWPRLIAIWIALTVWFVIGYAVTH
jgi:hypothetical protein